LALPKPFPVMKNAFYLPVLFLYLTLTSVNAQTTYTLNPATDFGTNFDGSIRPGNGIGFSPVNGNDVKICTLNNVGVQPGDLIASPIQTNGFNQRGMTYDAVTGHLIFVDTRTGQGGSQTMPPNSAVYVLDSTSGHILGAFNTNGIIDDGPGVGCVVTAGAADDGAIYVMNQINNNTGVINTTKLYRWPTADVTAPNFNNAPTVAFSNQLEVAERLVQTMDVRGAGPKTQIIVGSSSVQAATPGTNCWIFTTSDGTNFVDHRLFFPGITSANFNDGIAFGPGNTFFAKQVGKALLFLSWDTNTYTGSVIRIYNPSSPIDPLVNISGITWDPVTKLLGGLEEIGGTATGGPGKVWLFDFPNPTNQAPAVLASSVYPANFQKTTAPMGYVHFGAGKLYAHASNNGFLVNNVETTFLSPPTFNLDLPQNNKVSAGLTAHFEVQVVYDVTNYQWYSNNIAIPGANSYYYDIPNVQSTTSGQFAVVAFNAAGSATSATCTLSVVLASNFFHLTDLWSAVGGTTNYITANGGGGSPRERSIAYNALSNQLLVAAGPAGTAPKIFVVDANTGTYLYNLTMTGVSGGTTLTLCGIGVADDGAVYACNVSSDATYRIYRWPDSGPSTLAQVIFGTNSSAANANPMADQLGSTTFRFGDALAVHGSNINTEIIVDAANAPQYAGILHPTDSTMTNWVSNGNLMQNTPGSYGYGVYGATIGRSLQFGQNSTFWQKRYNGAAGAPAAKMTYTPGGDFAMLALSDSRLPLYTNGPMAINFQLGLAAAINFVGAVSSGNTQPDQLAYYDFSDPSQAVLLTQVNLAGSAAGGGHSPNNNAIAQVVFGTSTATGSNYLFVINGNNGINAYVLQGGTVPPPKILSQPHSVRMLLNASNNVSVSLDQPCTVTWYKGTNPPVNTGVTGTIYGVENARFSDSGDYFAIAANGNGSVTSQVAHVTVADATQFPTLTQVWAAPAGNASYPYITSNGGPNTPGERAFAFNALSNQLIVVHCPPASSAYSIAVVNGTSGSQLYTMNTTGIVREGASEVSGSNPIDLVGAACADDGALYVCSETPNASGGSLGDTSKMWHLYRWANTGPTAAPVMVFEGDPSGQTPAVNLRWGDVLTARGSGTNTQVFLNNWEGGYGAILEPTNSTLTGFATFFFSDAAGGGPIGRSVQFGTNDSVLEKRRGVALVGSSFVLSNQSSTLDFLAPSSTTLGGVAVDLTMNIAAGVDFIGSPSSPDVVSLYDISDPASPLLLGQYPFPQAQVANANAISETLIVGNRVYAMDGNNGFVAFNIVPPASSQAPLLNITLSGGNVILSWPQQGSFTLQGVAALSGSPIPWSDIGTGAAVNGQYVVTNGISSQATFYRLRQ
jgi:hypothetical protein